MAPGVWGWTTGPWLASPHQGSWTSQLRASRAEGAALLPAAPAPAPQVPEPGHLLASVSPRQGVSLFLSWVSCLSAGVGPQAPDGFSCGNDT